MTLAGGTLGTITAYASAPYIVERFGWDCVFLVYGIVGFVWTLLWSSVISDSPAEIADRSAAEPANDEPADIPWLAFATSLPLWAILIIETSHGEPPCVHATALRDCGGSQEIRGCCFAMAGIGQYMAFFWQPTFYAQVYGESLQDASLLSILPWAASALCTNVAGWVADVLINDGFMSLTAVRKLMAGLASFGPACFLLLLAAGMVRMSSLLEKGCAM